MGLLIRIKALTVILKVDAIKIQRLVTDFEDNWKSGVETALKYAANDFDDGKASAPVKRAIVDCFFSCHHRFFEVLKKVRIEYPPY